jgi:hypothetical protein
MDQWLMTTRLAQWLYRILFHLLCGLAQSR